MSASEDQIVQHFSERASSFDIGNWVADEGLLRAHTELVGDAGGLHVLDAGCGTGLLGAAFIGLGATVWGIDLCGAMVSKAASRLHQCVLGSVSAMPFCDHAFDLVLCRQLLHYVEPGPALSEIRRVLVGGGRLLVSQIVPYGDSDSHWFETRVRIKKPHQMWIPTRNSILDLVRSHGFECLRSHAFTTRSKLSVSTSRTEYERQVTQKVFDHYWAAPGDVRDLYDMRFSRHDVEYSCNWFMGLFGLEP